MPEIKGYDLTDEIFPRTDPKTVKKLYEMLKVVDRLFEREGIIYWIDGGTALGAVRHQGIIPWDDDIDLVYLMEEDQKIFNLASEFAEYGYHLQREEIFRLFPSKEIRYPYIDIQGHSLAPDNVFRHDFEPARNFYQRYYWKPEEVFPLHRIPFGPLKVSAANNMLPYLFRGYGKDCLTYATYQTSHGPEKVTLHAKVKIVDFNPAKER